MIKRTPKFAQLAGMVVFALSCFSLVLYLWVSFGGPVPLKPQGYRVNASFSEAVQLATEADVRISGVKVGKVKKITPSLGRTKAVLEFDERYAPLRSDVKATLRTKTLLGETYIELTPGSKGAKTIPENGSIAIAQVDPIVELDEVIRTFDPATRQAFGNWLTYQSEAVKNRGDELNQAFGALPMFFSDSNDLLTVLRRQDKALSRIFANTADTFEAINGRKGQLTDLITSSNKVLEATGNRSEQFAQTFREFPAFLRETRATLKKFSEFTETSQPLIRRSQEFAEEFSPTIRKSTRAIDDARSLIVNTDPLLDKADKGLPATDELLKLAQPTIAQLDPFLRQLNPVLEFVGIYDREITAFLGNDASAAQSQFNDDLKDRRSVGHLLRAVMTLNPSSLAYSANRTTDNRANAYPAPDIWDRLASGLQVFDGAQCTATPMPPLSPKETSVPAYPEDLARIYDSIKSIIYGGSDTLPVPAPACTEQPPFQFSGETTKFPHVRQRTSP